MSSLKNVDFLWKDINERNNAIAETSLANVEVKVIGGGGDEKSFHQHQYSSRAVMAQQQQNNTASASPRANAQNNIVFTELKEYNGPLATPPASAVQNSISNSNSSSNVGSSYYLF